MSGVFIADDIKSMLDLQADGFGSDSWLGNTNDSVKDYAYKAWEYVKSGYSYAGLITGIPTSERVKFSWSIANTSMDIAISLNVPYTSWVYYSKGRKYTQSSTLTKTGLTPAEGAWFVYIDTSNVLQVTQIPWTITNFEVLLFAFIWNSTTASAFCITDERHTAGRDIFAHARMHAQGAIYASGLLPVSMNSSNQDQTTLNGLADSNLRGQIRITNGSCWDEDIPINIVHQDNPSYDWNFNFKQFLGFSDTAIAGTNTTTIVFTSPHTFITGQTITCMNGSSATTMRGTATIVAGGTGTSFTVSPAITGMTTGDTIVVGARIPVFYRLAPAGSFTNWRRIDPTDYPYHSVTSVPQYNNSASVTGLSNVTNGRYFCMWIVATNSITYPIFAIMGQNESTNNNLTTYLSSALSDFNTLQLGNLPFAEMVPLVRLTFEYSSGYTNSKARLRDITNIRIRVTTSTSTNTIGDHSALANRSAYNSHPSTAISFGDIIPAADGVNSIRVLRNDATTVVAVVDTTNDRIGIGTLAPELKLHVADTSTSALRGIMSSQHNDGTHGARIHLKKSRGTNAAPTTVVSGDAIGRFVGSAYDGSNYIEVEAICFLTTGTIGANRIPTAMDFYTSTDASPSVPTLAMRINEKQQVVINDLTLYNHTASNYQGKFGVYNLTTDRYNDFAQWSADANGTIISMCKSRGATAGTFTFPTTNDILGTLAAMGADNTNTRWMPGAEIEFVANQTWTASANGARIVFKTCLNSSTGTTERFRITHDGKLSAGNEDAPDCDTGGLCLNQKAADAKILTLKSSDVSHSVTGRAEGDTYTYFQKISATDGGVQITGISDAAATSGALLEGIIGNATPTATDGAVAFKGYKYDGGTGVAALASTETIFTWSNNTTMLMSMTGDGRLKVLSDTMFITTPRTIANTGDAGTTGMICWDSNFIYVCIGTNSWARAGIATW